MSDLHLFKFEHQPVRIVLVDGEPWFVLADVCRVLGIANVGNVAARLHEDDIRQTDVTDTLSRSQLTKIVNEVVIRSDKKEAARFRRWVTHKVLPDIRRTGSYSHAPAAPAQLPSKRELAQWVIEAEERAEVAESRVRELTPSASAWNDFMWPSRSGGREMSDVVERAKAALEGVTPAPWHQRIAPAEDDQATHAEWLAGSLIGDGEPLHVLIAESPDPKFAYIVPAVTGDGPTSRINAEFIAAARDLVPELVAEVERLRKFSRCPRCVSTNTSSVLDEESPSIACHDCGYGT